MKPLISSEMLKREVARGKKVGNQKKEEEEIKIEKKLISHPGSSVSE